MEGVMRMAFGLIPFGLGLGLGFGLGTLTTPYRAYPYYGYPPMSPYAYPYRYGSWY